MLRIGVISDTHGLLRPQALQALAGAQHLIHAGDVGAPQVLEQLRLLAPITAVRGNNDVGAWAQALPTAVTFELEGLRLHLLHDVAGMDEMLRARQRLQRLWAQQAMSIRDHPDPKHGQLLPKGLPSYGPVAD